MKKLLAAVLVLAVLASAFFLWRNRPAESDTGELVLHGNVDIRQISLAFDASGRVMELHAEEGDRVRAGDVLALLDTRTVQLQAEQAKAQIEVHQQALLQLRNGARPEEIAQAQSRLAAAQSDAKRADMESKRVQGIVSGTQGRGVSAQEVERAKSAAQVAQAKVTELREALRLIELGPRAEEVAGAQAQLRAAQAQLALLEHQIGQGTLIAPADAVVRSRLLEPGDMATPQKPVFALALAQPKWVRVYVSEPDLGKVQPGQAARVFTDSAPDAAITGKVGYIASVAEFTPKSVQTEELRTHLVYEVRVLVEDANDAMRLGQPATVRLTPRASVSP